MQVTNIQQIVKTTKSNNCKRLELDTLCFITLKSNYDPKRNNVLRNSAHFKPPRSTETLIYTKKFHNHYAYIVNDFHTKEQTQAHFHYYLTLAFFTNIVNLKHYFQN